MTTVTPSKLITDYFRKTPSPVEKSNAAKITSENLDGDTHRNLHKDKITIVLPPTPENSPFKEDNKQAQHSPDIGATRTVSSAKDSVKAKRTAAKSLTLDRDNSGHNINNDNIAHVDGSKSTEVSHGTKKTRRRRKPRNKKAATLDQSTDVISSNSSTNSHKKLSTPQNKLVTDYFPIRRSGRRCESKIKEDRDTLLRQCIVNNCERGMKVEEFEGKGRGVLATKHFDAGDFVVEYAGELVLLSTAKKREDNYSKDEDIGCYMYYFEHKGKRYCVDATKETGRLGRLLNHSKLKGNCQTKVVEVDGSPRLILVAMTHINVGQELLYDYGDRSPSSIEAHPWLKT